MIVKKLIEIGDNLSSEGEARQSQESDGAVGGSPRAGGDVISSLEREIIECLRLGGDQASHKIDGAANGLINGAVRESVYERFSTTLRQSVGDEVNWNQMVLVFCATKSALKVAGAGTTMATQIKDLTLKYVTEKCASWIVDQGGWESIICHQGYQDNMASPSVQWRQKGNEVYKSVTDGLSPLTRKDRLNTALHHYNEAHRLARNANEKSSACKNIALAAWKMAPVIKVREEGATTVHFYYREALKYFKDARAYADDQSLQWVEGLLMSAIICWTEFLECLDTVDVDTRIHELHKAVDYVVDNLTRAQAYVEITHHYFHAGVTELQKKDYKKSLNLLKDCYFPLNEARRLGTSCGSVTAEVNLMEEDIFVQMSVTESIKARITGDELLTRVIRDEEVLNMDMIWEVIDWYRNAIVLTRERDFEMEAIAHSRLGQVYDHILHVKSKARENFNRALHLANLMVPRTFHGDDWYIMATAAMQRFQDAAVRADEKVKQQEKDKVKDEIKDDLTKLNLKFETSTKMEFLKFIYKDYPPKNPMYKKEEVPETPEMDQWKKLYCKAVVHYHPDKVDVEKHGLKWKVFSEEITKLLTNHYETMKS